MIKTVETKGYFTKTEQQIRKQYKRHNWIGIIPVFWHFNLI